MNESNNKNTTNILTDQIVAGVLLEELQNKQVEYESKIIEIGAETAQKVCNAESALEDALKYTERAKNFVTPENIPHILGKYTTKHGEIAEHIEVEITNAKNVFDRLKPIADIDNIGRTAPEDYIINGIPVQSKFINGANNTLDHVLDHIHNYPNFTKDATEFGYLGKQGYYQIPKDQFELIQKVLHGETTELSDKSIRAIQSKVQEIEEITERPFIEAVKPSISNYRDVQIGTAENPIAKNTIEKYEAQFRQNTEERIENIKSEQTETLKNAQHITDASWGEAAKTGLIGAGIGAVAAGGLKLFAKTKGQHKKITDLTTDDWKEIGYDFVKGGTRGGISGVAIYGLTKIAGFSAPFAGSMVSSAIGITSLLLDYRAGKINKNEFSQAACSLSIEAGLSAVGAAIGQAIIPIPVVGSVVGTLAVRAALETTRYITGNKEKELIAKMEHEYNEIISKLTIEEQKIINQIDTYFSTLNGLIEGSMSLDLNERMINSIELARYVGVPEEEIIHNIDELDEFMNS